MDMNLTAVIPTFNEVHTIREILQRVERTGLVQEILVVDDGSTDGTRQILAELNGQGNIRVVFHEKNQGKGAAVRTGLKNAKGDVILIQDADLELNPQDIVRMAELLTEGDVKVIYGSRFMAGFKRTANVSWVTSNPASI